MPFDPLRGALRDIREHIELARSFVAGMSFESFSADRRTAYAVTRCLEIISEASRKLPLDLKARHPAIPRLTVERSLGPLYSAILQELERLDEQ
jgi:uncharacterized protein with HEPN domain